MFSGMVHTFLILWNENAKSAAHWYWWLPAVWILGKSIERMQTLAKIMMPVVSEVSRALTVPDRGKTGRMKLIGRVPWDSWGKNTTNPTWRANSRACVCPRDSAVEIGPPQQLVLREGGLLMQSCAWALSHQEFTAVDGWMWKKDERVKRKIWTNPTDALASPRPQGFLTLDAGASKVPDHRQNPGQRMERASQWSTPEAKRITNKRGWRERAERRENNKQLHAVTFLEEIAKVTSPLLNRLGDDYSWRLGY